MPSQDDINHQITLLNILRGNLGLLTKQRAMYDPGLIPVQISNGIQDARNNVARIKDILNHWNIDVDDMPGIDYDVEDQITLRMDRSLYERIKQIVYQYGIEI